MTVIIIAIDFNKKEMKLYENDILKECIISNWHKWMRKLSTKLTTQFSLWIIGTFFHSKRTSSILAIKL